MSFKGEDLLPFLKHLLDDAVKYSTEEEKKLTQAALRTIISRAYYSAFLKARSFVGLDNDDSGSIHRKVQEAIFKIDISLANSLESLKKDRTKADYRINNTFNMRNAKNSLRQSRKVIAALNEKG